MRSQVALNYRGTIYYEQKVVTQHHLRTAAELANSYYLTDPPSARELEKFLYDTVDREPELWLLSSQERPIEYRNRIDKSGHVRAVPVLQSWYTPRYHAVLAIAAWHDEETAQNPPVVSLEALCCDPWVETEILPVWVDLRLMELSNAMGGARELRVSAPECDLVLQQGFKSMGYYCEGPGPSMMVDHKGHDRLDNDCHVIEELHFVKTLRLRPRQSLGFPTPRRKSKKK